MSDERQKDQRLQQRPTDDLARAALSLEEDRDVDDDGGGGSRGSETLSSISDSITKAVPLTDAEVTPLSPAPAQASGVDGGDFLQHLRAAGAFDSELKNEDTFGFSETRNTRQNLNQLSELFEAPAPAPTAVDASGATLPGILQRLSNDDTIGRSNKTPNPQNNQPKPRLSSLSELFAGPAKDFPAVPMLPLAPPRSVESAPIPINNIPTTAAHAARPPLSPVPQFSSISSSSSQPRVSPIPVLKRPDRSPGASTLTTISGGEPLNEQQLPPQNLSAGMPARPRPVQSHNRTVSWGNNTTLGPSIIPSSSSGDRSAADGASGIERELSRGGSFDSVSSLGGLDAGGPNAHRRTNTRTQLTLEDLLGNGPYEAEAESNILHALETQQAIQRSRPRLGSASLSTRSIMGQVPESAAHDFSVSESQSQAQSQRSLSGTSVPMSPRSAATTGRGEERKDSEKMKLMNNKLQRQRHRRHLSVEATLVDLTEAMSALHGGTAKTRQSDEPFSSADRFAENATRLSEQQIRNKKDRDLAPNHIRNRVWRIDNLPMVEEHRRSGGTPSMDDDDDNNSKDDEIFPDLEKGQPKVSFADEEDDDVQSDTDTSDPRLPGSSRTHRKSKILEDAGDKLKSEWEVFDAFFRPRRVQVKSYLKNMLLYVVVPLTGIAAILFYLGGNPIQGISEDGSPGNKPSVAWWLLFGVREVVTFSMALAMQGFLVDFLSLGSKIMLHLVGPTITLLIVQSKGWPFIACWWAIFNFGMLGNNAFGRQWLFWSPIGLFNAENPSGNIVGSSMHMTILTITVSVSVVVAIKRFLIGLYLGRQTFAHYGEQLAKVMNSMLLVSEVADLARDIDRSRVDMEKRIPVLSQTLGWNFTDDTTVGTPTRSMPDESKIDINVRDPLTGSLPADEKTKLMQLLGQWEVPNRATDPRQTEIASISAVLRFRKALTFIQKRYPFSYAFGLADTRENCIASSQKVYDRLMLRTPDEPVLPFETLALLALVEDEDEIIDQQKAKALVKLFRPDREGYLSVLDFVRSVDSVYKEFRMLSASIQNSSTIDRAFENMFNVGFYIAVVTVVMSALGFNPLALFLSLSSVILGFAFMIGSASSKYFEGVLFILVRRPYGIGDRIHVSDVERDTSIEGSAGWVVENVTLFETTATWTPTKERCSLSNGSLANSRIINGARSPQAQFHLFLKFPIDEPYEKILIFKSAIEEYMRARPREWLALNGFRAFEIVADQGYVKYAIVIQHRESWQNVGQILDSKANLSSYCNEVAKQLKMHYRAPPLPVDLRFADPRNATAIGSALGNNMQYAGGVGAGSAGGGAGGMPQPPEGTIDNEINPTYPPGMTEMTPLYHHQAQQPSVDLDPEAQMKKFRQLALDKHNIRLN